MRVQATCMREQCMLDPGHVHTDSKMCVVLYAHSTTDVDATAHLQMRRGKKHMSKLYRLVCVEMYVCKSYK